MTQWLTAQVLVLCGQLCHCSLVSAIVDCCVGYVAAAVMQCCRPALRTDTSDAQCYIAGARVANEVPLDLSRTCWNTLFFLLSVLSHCSCPTSFDRQWWAWIRRAVRKMLASSGEASVLLAEVQSSSRPELLREAPPCHCSMQLVGKAMEHSGSSRMHSKEQFQGPLLLSGQSRLWTPYLGLMQRLY